MEEMTIKDGMTVWTESTLKREITKCQNCLEGALSEVRAGNERMRAYAEGYASRRDSMQILLYRLLKKKEGLDD